jgi:hypothetical protein
MSQNRDKAGRLQPEDQVVQTRWWLRAWRFKQQVTSIVESEGPILAQLERKIRGDMHICASDQGDRYPGFR